jgi:hypothetical protein
MPRKVTAKAGDSLCNIAFRNGFGDCKPLREEAANAFIVNRADDPGQVLPDDIVTVPDFIEHSESKGTEKKHKFVKRDNMAILRFVHGSASSTVKGDRTLTFLNVSNYIANLAGVPDGQAATPLPGSAVRNFNASADKDPDVFKIEVFDIDATADLTVDLEVLRPTYNAAGTVTGHQRFPAAIRAARLLTPTASQQGTTKRFRTCYLKLVTDALDKAAVNDQTLLTSDIFTAGDAAANQVEILDQVVKASYTLPKCPQNPKCRSTVVLPIGEDRRRLRVAVHILRHTVTNAPIVQIADVEQRIFTWVRRVYAQASFAPKIVQASRIVDPPANLISISDDGGERAAGDGQVGFRISAPGHPPLVVGPITPTRNHTPRQTADRLAALVVAPFAAVVSVNPARSDRPVSAKSADLVITAADGARITIDLPLTGDSRQSLTVGRVDSTLLPIATGLNNMLIGTIEQRTILKNLDSGEDRLDIFVVVAFNPGARGLAMVSGHRVDAARKAVPQVRLSTFLTQIVADNTDNNPFSFPHELGHVTGEVFHALGANQQLMRSGTSAANNVNGSKRIRDGIVNYDAPMGDLNLVRRLRRENRTLLENW